MILIPAATYSSLDRFGLFCLLGSRSEVTTWTDATSTPVLTPANPVKLPQGSIGVMPVNWVIPSDLRRP